MTQELVNLTIDGVAIAVAKGTSIIEAAKQAGVLIPHYCYHPSLSAPAVCRMCLVDVEKAPKVMPACVTAVAEGQVVHTRNQKALEAREAVLEFLLINHPLDCPICDQAGECELQDFVFQEGRSGTRYADYPKRYAPVEDFGPDVLYVPNRCILCTRCVRFMEEVATDPVIDVFDRGDRAYIGRTGEQNLDHEWAGNVVDLCPVGSLISKDFLHKARAWDLDKTASVCTGCSQGCNTMLDTRDDVVVRIRPRPNLDVNRHFICDTGRMDYRWMNRGDRVEAPLLRQGGRLQAADWDPALDRVAELIRAANGRVVVLASGRASTEGLGWAMRMVEGRDVLAAVKVPLGDERALPGVPNLALRPERAPNGDGARLLGYTAAWGQALSACSGAALVIVLDAALDDAELAQATRGSALVAFLTVDDERFESAEVVLPVTTFAEENGTFVNRDGRVQRYMQARTAPGMSRPIWWAAANVWERGGAGRAAPATPADAFARLSERVSGLGGLTWTELGLTGRTLDGVLAPGGVMTPELKGFLLLTAVKLLAIFSITMVGVAYMTLMERWVSAWMQDRKGPNRVGWKGIGQPIADGIKNLIKEETFPPHTNRILFLVAPALSFIPALLMGSVIPWASPIPVQFDFTLPLLGQFTHDGLMPIQVADLPIGFLFVLAVGSIGVYGIALAGWASNSKYSLLGGLRSSAQMVSYEIAMGMSLIPVLLLAGNVRFTEIIASQQDGLWYVLPLFISFFIFGVAGLAEINRAPFDLPEAESELVAGYHTEYSAFKFSMFFIAEYANMMTYGAMLAILFFGGWDIPFTRWDETPGLLQTLATGAFMFLKVTFAIFVVMWLRWTLPRFRFDQLMSLGWKFMIPAALSYIMIMTIAIWAVDTMVPGDSLRLRQLVLFGLNVVLAWILFVLLDRGTIISGAYRVPRGAS